jgi:type IV pilus assembly protein PilC
MDWRARVKGALVYPIVVAIVAGGVTFAMLTYIVPVFAKMFSGMGAELPGPTKTVMGISNFLQANSIPIFIGMAALIIGFNFALRYPEVRLNFDRFKLRMPLL